MATRLFTPEVGAAAFRLKALVDGLVAAGADVSVVTTRAPGGATAGKFPTGSAAGPCCATPAATSAATSST